MKKIDIREISGDEIKTLTEFAMLVKEIYKIKIHILEQELHLVDLTRSVHGQRVQVSNLANITDEYINERLDFLKEVNLTTEEQFSKEMHDLYNEQLKIEQLLHEEKNKFKEFLTRFTNSFEDTNIPTLILEVEDMRYFIEVFPGKMNGYLKSIGIISE